MSDPISPFEAHPPSAKRLMKSIVLALVAAAIVLTTLVLPAEYGIDPTGVGKALGLTALNAPTRSLTIEQFKEGKKEIHVIKIPAPGEPTPLENPAVIQIKSVEPQTRTMTVKLQPDQETEVKAIMDTSQVLLYSWKAEGGEVYTDFHGHEPSMGQGFVRYEEQQSGHEGRGSLVAPFTGEHGWYWLSIAEKPVTITLTVTGYFNDIKDYGIFKK